MSKGKIALAIAVGFFVVYMVASPYITANQMRLAAEAHDGEALSEYIEFPSVRQSLKDQMNVLFLKELSEDEGMQDNPFAALGAAFAGMVVEKMVDAYVTPTGITQLMLGENPEPGFDQRDYKKRDKSSSAEPEPFAKATMAYESFDKFVIRVDTEDGGEAKFVLRRRGLGWKLTEIILPLE